MNRPLRVLRLISHLGSGGTERQCVEVLAAIHARRAELGIDIEVATFWNRGHLHSAPEGLVWHRLDQRASAFGAAQCAAKLAVLLRKKPYDCVHALLWPAAALALPVLPRRTALLTSIHSTQIQARRGKAAVLRAIGMRTDLLVFNNEPGVEALRERFGVLAAQTRVRANGKALAGPLQHEARSGIVCVARDVPSKRQALLLDAWLALDASSRPPLTFIGRGTDVGALGSQIRNAGALGLGEVEDPGVHLARASIAALPTDHEGMPNAVLEGWNHGATVIASNVTGVRDLVRDGQDGRLVNNEVTAWTQALQALIDGPARARSLARAGRARLEAEFSLARTAAGWVDLYHEATRARGHGL